jgi:predicted dehydrogenase
MVRTNLGPIRTDVDAAWDLASHDISIANYWLGSVPESVSATGGNWINPGITDTVFATLRYPQNVLVHLHASWLNPRKVRDVTVVCETKMLTFDDMQISEPIRIYDKRVTPSAPGTDFVDTFATFRSSVREGNIVIPSLRTGEPLRDECDHFIRSIDERSCPMTDGRNGVDVVRVLEAMDRSRANGGATEELT